MVGLHCIINNMTSLQKAYTTRNVFQVFQNKCPLVLHSTYQKKRHLIVDWRKYYIFKFSIPNYISNQIIALFVAWWKNPQIYGFHVSKWNNITLSVLFNWRPRRNVGILFLNAACRRSFFIHRRCTSFWFCSSVWVGRRSTFFCLNEHLLFLWTRRRWWPQK